MGNQISGICGYSQENNKYELNHLTEQKKQFYTKAENLEKVKQIQGKFRSLKSKSILQDNLKIFEEQFDNNLTAIGNYVDEEEFDNSINSSVKEIDQMLGPLKFKEEEYRSKFKNIFKKPPIKFHDEGSIYKGDWNIQGKKHGYGVLVTKEGSKFEGFWKNDQLDGIGRFIEKKGNYYDGIYIK
jgi:hypothetical protein